MDISDETWQKLWAHAKTGSPDECWPWQGTLSGGTPMFFITRPGRGGLNTSARRVIWNELHADDQLDTKHIVAVTCDERACVNPAHFEKVTRREFALRNGSATSANANRTHCKSGHEFTPDNTYLRKDGRGRQCRQCARDQVQKLRARKKLADARRTID